MPSASDIEALSVREVFASGRYVVPIYQRAYAWGEAQILTLLQDVRDYRRRGAASYYIGSLVTHRGATQPAEGERFEVVDGQQRLTTLFIILRALSDQHEARLAVGVLSYEGRAAAARDMGMLERAGFQSVPDDFTVGGIRVAVETVRGAWESGQFSRDDLQYLIDRVMIARTTLPARTDLNHYFEVMNSRGEQLEKHEIVKAHLMSLLANGPSADARSHAFAVVWDACSDLTRHVQARFPTSTSSEHDVRGALFGKDTWDDLQATNFDGIVSAVTGGGSGTLQPTSLSEILRRPSGTPDASTPERERVDDAPERYGAIIDFPNFLLHALALSVAARASFSWYDSVRRGVVSLDDKKLVEQFEAKITTAEGAERFAFTLLRCRYLFDRYVIKTDLSRASDDDSNWVLSRVRLLKSNASRKLSPVSTFAPGEEQEVLPRVNSDHWHVVMLQSMFQVTDSRRAYKNFLYAILDFLYRQTTVTAPEFIAFLQGLARDRYVATIESNTLDGGTSVPHFALNYLDYLLWRDASGGGSVAEIGIDVSTYRFRYRTSIEHYYPQHPDADSQIETLEKDVVDQFGNLCIMTRSENSKRSNLAPAAKVEQYRSDRQTLKFQVMAAITKRESAWTTVQMEDHGRAMRRILQEAAGGATRPELTLGRESGAGVP